MRRFFRLWCRTPHHQRVGAVVNVGIRTKVSVLDGAFHRSTSPGSIHPGGSKQFWQRNVIPLAHHVIQQLLQLAGAVHPQAGQQRTAAANGHDDIGKQLPGVGQNLPCTDDIHRIRHPGKQENGTHNGADGGNIFMPLLCTFLLCRGNILPGERRRFRHGCGIWGGAVVTPGTGCFLFFLLHLLVDAFQDKQQHPQRPGHRHDDKDGNGGNLCKIMFSRLHETGFLSQKDKNKTAFHSIIAERGLFVKGVFLFS